MEFDELPGILKLDWMTAASSVPAHSGELWHGSLSMGRFERVGSNGGYRVGYTLDPGSRHCLTLTGEKLLRRGISWEEVLGDVWGPGVACTAQRLDWAWEYTGARPVDLAWLAWEVSKRLPPTRFGWDTWSFFSPTCTTYYYGALGQAGKEEHVDAVGVVSLDDKDRLESARSKPLFIRVYQKRGKQPRIEAECKKLSGVALRDALRQTAYISTSFMPGRPSWTDGSSNVGVVPVDGRADPCKLVRQAYGLLRAAALRTGVTRDGYMERDDKLQDMWVEVVSRATGLRWEEVKPKRQPRLPPKKGVPVAVIQGCGEGELDLANTVPMVQRGGGKSSPSSPLGDFYAHFCKGFI